MTQLFQRIQPLHQFEISISAVAKLLKIPQHLIVRVECWAYVVFVHRRDVGGQFISYRKLRNWQNAIACQIQKSSTWQQLQKIWQEIIEDSNRHFKQYEESNYQFLRQVWNQRRFALIENPKSKIQNRANS